MTMMTPYNLMWLTIATVIGIIIGAIPGLTAGMALVLFIPLTFHFPHGTALMILAALYTSASYGGDITAILINTPGTPDSIFMTIDGHPMALKGQAAKALGLSTMAAFIGGLLGAASLLWLAPVLANWAMIFGPMEMFLTSMLGITIIIGICKENMLMGMISAMLGFIMSMVGMDQFSGLYRLTLGQLAVAEGLPLGPVMLGLFAVSQVLIMVDEGKEKIAEEAGNVSGSLFPSLKEGVGYLWNAIRSGVIGTIVGIIPAAGSTIACGISYNEAKRTSKHPETFGHGEPHGLVSVSAANNGVVGGSLVPLLTLGIPGNGTSAIFLGGLIIHGLKPGQELFTKHADIAGTLLIGMFFCQLWMLILGLGGAKLWAKVTKIRTSVMVPIIMVFCVIGAFASRSLVFDMILMMIFGYIGYFFEKVRVPLAPFVLGFVLGPLAEVELRRALLITNNVTATMFQPLNLILLIMNILFLLSPFFPDIKKLLNRSKTKMA